jgi:hypothetical protein
VGTVPLVTGHDVEARVEFGEDDMAENEEIFI